MVIYNSWKEAFADTLIGIYMLDDDIMEKLMETNNPDNMEKLAMELQLEKAEVKQ